MIHIKFKNFFYLLAIAYPIIIALILSNHNEIKLFIICGIKIKMHCDSMNALIAKALAVVTIVANCYSISQSQLRTIIIGGCYFIAALICLYADDFISFFVALEAMMLAACALIYIGYSAKSKLLAVRAYFIIHLISGTMIFVAINYLIVTTGSSDIVSTNWLLLSNNSCDVTIGAILLIGCLMNAAAVPFSYWIINCYPSADNASFIYLMTFGTKLSVIILAKLFYGIAILEYCGFFMIIYGGFYACKEDNIKRLLCFLSIAQTGLMLIIISISNTLHPQELVIRTYIANHIIYNALLTALAIILENNANISTCSNLKRIKNPLWVTAISGTVLVALNVPFTTGFLLKHAILLTATVEHHIIYQYIFILFNIISFISLPIKEYFSSKEVFPMYISNFQILGIIIPISALIFINIHVIQTYYAIIPFINNVVEQLVIIAISLALSLVIKVRRQSVKLISIKLSKLIFDKINKYYADYGNKNNNLDIIDLKYFIMS